MKQFKSDVKLGQVITKEEIASWQGNCIFNCGTATGKSTLILTVLSEYCLEINKKILFLCSRKALVKEIEGIIERDKIPNVDVMTYQSIEHRLKKGNELILEYDYLALDEFHYMLEYYNHYTDISFKYLMKHPAQKIFMSATCDQLFDTFVENGIVPESQYYYIPKDYNYVNSFYFYNKKNDHELIIEDVINNTTDEKVIFFTQSLTKANEIYRQYEDISTFYCSQYTTNQESKEILNKNLNKIHNEQFEGRLLIATSALDVGITLKDYNIKHIILDIYDHSVLTQCLGRKRIIDDTDTCNVYIRNYHKGELNTKHNRHFNSMQLFVDDQEEFYLKYGSDRSFNNPFIYYDKVERELKMNYLAYIAIKSDEENLELMTKYEWTNGIGETVNGIGYKTFICNKLGISIHDERVLEYDTKKEEIHLDNLTTYLDSIVGKRLFKEEQKYLKDEFIKDGLKARTIGINTLNGNLKDRKLPYVIESETDNRRSVEIDGEKVVNPTRSKVYWIIGKINY